MVSKEMRENEELKDVLTAISVVAKRLRDQLAEEKGASTKESSTEPEDVLDREWDQLKAVNVMNDNTGIHFGMLEDIRSAKTVMMLIDSYNALGNYHKMARLKMYRTPGTPENKDKIEGYRRACRWYSDMKASIIDMLPLLRSENNEVREKAEMDAEDTIETVIRERKRTYESFTKDIFSDAVDKDAPKEKPTVFMSDIDYSTVQNSRLLKEDGTLELTRYSDVNVEFSYDFDPQEGALQEDHNKMVEIYELVSSLSPMSYDFGAKSRADILRQLADDIEMAETGNFSNLMQI